MKFVFFKYPFLSEDGNRKRSSSNFPHRASGQKETISVLESAQGGLALTCLPCLRQAGFQLTIVTNEMAQLISIGGES